MDDFTRQSVGMRCEAPRKSGLSAMGDMPWGTHFCLLYQTAEELLEVLTPYFAAGLAENEYCIWVTSDLIDGPKAKAALSRAIPRLDAYMASGQMEIVSYADWYIPGGQFDGGRVLRAWGEKLAVAEQRGFEGLRLTGDTFWLEKAAWQGFADYEAMVDRSIGSKRMLALCAYPLPKCSSRETFDVIANHDFAMIKEGDRWLSFKSAGQRRLGQALHESEERFSRFMRHLMAYAWIKDEGGRYLFANDAFAKVTRKPIQQILGKTDEEIFDAETATVIREHDRLAVESPSGLTTIEHIVAKDGATRHYLVRKFPIHCGPEQETRIGGIAIDDTQRVQAEEKLQEATEKLREADRRKDEFLAMLAHELRNPLAPLRSGLHVLRASGGQGPAADKIHGIMEQQVEHLVRLVDDLLDISRVSRGVIKLKKEPLDLRRVVENAVEMSRQLAEANNLELRVDLPKEALRLVADPIRLTQVVANLLNNAAKYTDSGGRVEVLAERQGDEAVVTVADTGVGIPADMLARVFDLFTQVGRTLDRSQGGLGIGLALVRNLVEQHGGRVEAMSDGEGKGARFVVRLPLANVVVEEALT